MGFRARAYKEITGRYYQGDNASGPSQAMDLRRMDHPDRPVAVMRHSALTIRAVLSHKTPRFDFGSEIPDLNGQAAIYEMKFNKEAIENNFRALGKRFGKAETGAVAIGDAVEVGSTVQFHVRDAVTADEVQAALTREFTLTPLPGRGAAPAERYAVDGGPGVVGIIASVSRPFCGSCDRLRLTADGQLRSCLFASGETDLRTPLRAGASASELTALIHACLAAKAPGHGINDPGFLQPRRPMSAIGG